MTRSRRSAWTDDEIINVMAYLDHYTKKRRENGRWSDDEILSRVASHIKSRSSNQVRGKIFALWGLSSKASTRNRSQNVFRFGSRCLKLLPDRLKPKIRELIKVIEFNEESEQMRTPQILRNGKERSVSIEPRWLRLHRSVSIAETPVKSSLTDLPSAALRQVNTAADRLKKESNEDDLMLTVDGIDLIDFNVDLQPNQSHKDLPTEVADSIDSDPLTDLDPSRGTTPDEEHLLTRQRLAELDDIPCIPVAEHERSIDTPLPTQNPQTDRKYDLLRDLLEDNRYLRKKVLQIEKENEQLNFRHRALSNIQRRIEKDPSFSQVSIILECQQVIADLERSIKLQNHVIPSLQDSSNNVRPSNFGQVTHTFNNLVTAICCLVGTENFHFDLETLYQSPSPRLRTLLQRCLPQDFIAQSTDSTSTQTTDEQMGSKIVASLTAAAVCEWVFIADSRCAILLSTPIHDSYRQLLRAGCGEQVVRSLDILAHQSILQDQNFREVYLVRSAERYLAGLLEVFCEINNQNVAFKHDAQVGHQIKTAFLHALTLKYDLALREEKVRINWPAPGSMFDNDRMNIYDPEKGHAAQVRKENGALATTMTLVPGLQGHHYRKERVDDVVFFEIENDITTNLQWTLQGVVSIK